jgi:WD40 domain-containing protein
MNGLIKRSLYIFMVLLFVYASRMSAMNDRSNEREKLVQYLTRCVEKSEAQKPPVVYTEENYLFSEKNSPISLSTFSADGVYHALVKGKECVINNNKIKIKRVIRSINAERITSCAFAYNNHFIIGRMGAKDNLTVWDMNTNKMLANLGERHDARAPHILHIACHPCHNYFASVGYFDALLHNLFDDEKPFRFVEQKNIKAIQWSPKGDYLVSGNDETVIIRDGNSGELMHKILCSMQAIAWNPLNGSFASVSDNKENNLMIWDSKTGTNIGIDTDSLASVISDSSRQHDAFIVAVPKEKRSRHIFCLSGEDVDSSDEDSIDIVGDDSLIDTVYRHVFFSKNGKYLVSVAEKHHGKNNSVVVRRTDTFEIVDTLTGSIIGDTVAMSPNGKYFLFATKGATKNVNAISISGSSLRDTICLYDFEEKKTVNEFSHSLNENIHLIQWHPNGRSLFSFSDHPRSLWLKFFRNRDRMYNELKDEQRISDEQIGYLSYICSDNTVEAEDCTKDQEFIDLPEKVQRLLLNYIIKKKSVSIGSS